MSKIDTIDDQCSNIQKNISFVDLKSQIISFICVKIKRFLPNRWSKFLPELIFVADNNLGKLRSGDRLCRGGQTRWHCWCLELGQSTEMENSLVRCKNSMWLFFWQRKFIFTDTRKILVGKENLCTTLNKKKRRGLPSKLLWEAKTTSREFWH